jgi:hypothetical protein
MSGPGSRSSSAPASAPRLAVAGHQGWASLWVYLMRGAGELAQFLGPEQATSTLLPTFMWLPNESDWRVRAAFYKHLPSVSQGLVCPLLIRSAVRHIFTVVSFSSLVSPRVHFSRSPLRNGHQIVGIVACISNRARVPFIGPLNAACCGMFLHVLFIERTSLLAFFESLSLSPVTALSLAEQRSKCCCFRLSRRLLHHVNSCGTVSFSVKRCLESLLASRVQLTAANKLLMQFHGILCTARTNQRVLQPRAG